MSESTELASLYLALLTNWNERDAFGFGALFADDGSMVGFDGSSVEGREAIVEHLDVIFTDHDPARYVAKIREIRELAPTVAMLRAVAGMVPPGGTEIKPEVNAIQELVAVTDEGAWKIAHFQNTPASFDGRPEAVAALTAELEAVRAAGHLIVSAGS